MAEDIDLELGQGKEGQQNHQEEKAARPEERAPPGENSKPPPANWKWNWKWKDEVPFLLLGVLYMALGVVIIVVFVYRTDDAVARKMLLWVGGFMAALGGVVFLRFVAGIFKSLLAT